MMQPVLEVKGLRKVFERRGHPDFTAVDGVDFAIQPGECVGLVGGSGCGKSTVAQMITRLLEPTDGEVALMGRSIAHATKTELRMLSRDVQMVFQNPVSSFDPRRTLADGIAEGLRNAGTGKREAHERAVELLVRCGLPAELADRYPREVSGGQCQRAAIARALATDPALIIFDEATSALDVTVQAQIVELLGDIRREIGAAYLFICHDLALVQGFCDRVLVMRAGVIVEEGPAASVIANPRHPYTRQLVDAVLSC
jgi:peptide/nickel transport system ATP-binding protein